MIEQMKIVAQVDTIFYVYSDTVAPRFYDNPALVPGPWPHAIEERVGLQILGGESPNAV